MKTLEEVSPEEIAAKNKWECVVSYPLNTISQILAASRKLNPIEAGKYCFCFVFFLL
jgi:hypothetical protein